MAAGRTCTVLAAIAAGLIAAGAPGFAHKPITSPYTFTEDVSPILRAHCNGCHTAGGPAPMSLRDHGDAVPWAESIRLELIAGRMPPSPVESAHVRNVKALAARDLNVLLTWAAGGTPKGAEAEPAPEAAPAMWRLGEPHLQLHASETTLEADAQERVADVALSTELANAVWVRALEIRPGAPGVVRAAALTLASPPDEAAPDADRLLALWLPGEPPVTTGDGTGFLLPAHARLMLRIHYRKTWLNERDVIRDRTVVGLHLADQARTLHALTLTPAGSSTSRLAGTLPRALTVAAVAVEPAERDVSVAVRATRADGTSRPLLSARVHADWPRRYWLETPVDLPAGSRIEAVLDGEDDEAAMPPGMIRRPASGLSAGRGPGQVAITVTGTVAP
jgi:hypothetical protein